MGLIYFYVYFIYFSFWLVILYRIVYKFTKLIGLLNRSILYPICSIEVNLNLNLFFLVFNFMYYPLIKLENTSNIYKK